MNRLIEQYISSRKNAWAATTLKSEKARLLKLSSAIDGNPQHLYDTVQQLKPYTRCTVWTRVSDFWQWLMDNGHKDGPNPYSKYRKDNARLFRNAYKKEVLQVSYDEAVKAILTLPVSVQSKAMEMLGSAQRWCEAVQSGPEVIGKGGKVRTNLVDSPAQFDKSYTTFYRSLKSVGLKPHTLRKLALTRAVQNGANEFDLMQIAGWASIAPAASYIQPKRKQELKELLK
jgi:integrase